MLDPDEVEGLSAGDVVLVPGATRTGGRYQGPASLRATTFRLEGTFGPKGFTVQQARTTASLEEAMPVNNAPANNAPRPTGPVAPPASGQQVDGPEGQHGHIDDGPEQIEDPKHRARPPSLRSGRHGRRGQGEHGQGDAPGQLMATPVAQPPLEGRQPEGHRDQRRGDGRRGLGGMVHGENQARPGHALA